MNRILENKKRHLLFILLLLVVAHPLFVPLAHAQINQPPPPPPPEPEGSGLIAKIISGFSSALTLIAGEAIGWIIFTIAWIISFIVGLFVAVEAWLIGVILKLSTDIINTPPVQIGFEVVLSVVNLGFVIAIVIIAVATILRFESYAAKQTLWKLIVAAILVNFSLVIVAPLLGFVNELTNYFLEPFGDPAGFASDLSASANPQRFSLVKEGTSAEDLASAESILLGFADAAGSGIAKLVGPLFGIFLTVLGLLIIVLALAGVFVMLVIRYVVLSILLILMPFAWLFWILPNLRHLWTRWWSAFFRWSFFAPILIFFLFLAIKTSSLMDDDAYVALDEDWTLSSTDSVVLALVGVLSTFFATIVASLMQSIVIIGLMVGGLIAANKMSITGAGALVKGISGMTKGVGRYAAGRAAGAAARQVTRERKPGAPPPEAKTWYGKLGQRVASPFRQGGEVHKRVREFGAKEKLEREKGERPGPFGALFYGFGEGSGLWKGKKKKLTKKELAALGILEEESVPPAGTTP